MTTERLELINKKAREIKKVETELKKATTVKGSSSSMKCNKLVHIQTGTNIYLTDELFTKIIGMVATELRSELHRVQKEFEEL